jgi:uncharacterized ferritin-like protein (DUF455 family)
LAFGKREEAAAAAYLLEVNWERTQPASPISTEARENEGLTQFEFKWMNEFLH